MSLSQTRTTKGETSDSGKQLTLQLFCNSCAHNVELEQMLIQLEENTYV